MLRLALLTVVGMAILPQPNCFQEESEPNGSMAMANVAPTPLPAWPPVAVCAEAGGADVDFWRIPLDYHTSWMCEGAAHFTLDTTGACQLALLVPQGFAGLPAYKVIGRWRSAVGHIETGQVGVPYYWRYFDHLIAVVEVNGRPAPYQLSYW